MWGKVCAEHVKALQYYGVDVVALCGRTISSAHERVVRLSLEARCYDDLSVLLEKESCEIITIAGPPELHAEHTVLAARAGRHMVIEKPVALNHAELDAMIAEVEKTRVKTIVGFVLRWNDLIVNIKNMFWRELGNVFLLETDYWHGSSHAKQHREHEYGTRAAPISAFLGGGCHAVDIARYLKGADIVSVQALSPIFNSSATQLAMVQFSDGGIGKISASHAVFMPYAFNLRALGSSGMIDLNKFYCRNMRADDYMIIPGQVPNSGAVWHHPFQGMVGELVRAIQQDRPARCSLQESYNTHLTCFAVEESAKSGGKIISLR